MISLEQKEKIAISIAQKYINVLIIIPVSLYMPGLDEIIKYKMYTNVKITISDNFIDILEKRFNDFSTFIFVKEYFNDFEIIFLKKLATYFPTKKFINI